METANDQASTSQQTGISQVLAVLTGLAIAAILIAGLVIATRGGRNVHAGTGTIPSADPFEIDGYEFVQAIGGPSVPNQPADTVVGPDGTVYVADVGLNRVLAFNDDGGLETRWGNDGMSQKLAGPLRLALDSDGNLYVVEFDGNSIQKFDPSGTPLTKWNLSDEVGPQGNDRVLSTPPFGIVIDQSGNVYVAERATEQVEKFDGAGQLLDTWRLNTGQLHDIAIDSQDRMYLPGKNVRVVDTNGETVTEWETGAMSLVIRDGTVYSLVQANPENNVVFKIRRSDLDGNLLSEKPVELASPITRTNILVSPGVDDDGNVYLGDPGTQRVAAFGPDGTVVREITGENNKSRFTGLTDVEADEDGNVYGADPLLGTVQKFAPNGRHLASLNFQSGRGRSMSTAFEWSDLAVASDGTVYVVDTERQHITIFSPDGEKVNEWGRFGVEPGDEMMEEPASIALDGQGHLFVRERRAGQNKKFTTDGEFVRQWPIPEIDGANGRLVDFTIADSIVYALSRARIQTFDLEGNPLDVVTSFDASSESPDEGQLLMHLAVDGAGNSYATSLRFIQDSGAVEIRMRKFSPDGERLQTRKLWQYDRYETAIAIAIGPNGALYLTDPANKRILVYQPAG